MKLVYNLFKFIESNQISLLVFFSSLFVLTVFTSTRMLVTDEATILNQFYNMIHGSISLEAFKIKTTEGAYLLYGDKLYGRFSYSLLFISLPIYYILREIDLLYGAYIFILLLWSLSGGVIIYLITKVRKLRYAEVAGTVSFYVLFASNIYLFKPIYFPRWGELLSIEFTNIIISSFLVLFIYLLFKKIFGNKLAIFASIFVILATPISFYAITLKHHSLSLLLTIMTFFFFYKYNEKKENKFIYSAYVLAALNIWVRTLDGIVLMATLLFTDLVIFRRTSHRLKHIFSISIITIIFLIPFFSFNYLILGNPFSIMEKTPGGGKLVTVKIGQDAIIFDENPPSPKKVNILLNNLGYVKTRINLGIIIRQGSGEVDVFRNDSGNWISLGNTTTSKTYTVIRGSQLKIVATPSTGYIFEKYIDNNGTTITTNPKIVYQNWNGGLDTYFNITNTNLGPIIKQDSGTVTKGDSWQNAWQDVVLYTIFLKSGNTFGIFLVSPFLIVSLVSILEILRQKIKINMFDKFLGSYTVLLFYSYKDFLFPAIIDSPMLLENRYLLIIYTVLLYFAFRIDKVRDLIENKLNTIFLLYGTILMVILSYFIKKFPVPFINMYYHVALITSFSLLILLAIGVLIKRIAIVDNVIILSIALSIALASSFLIFYYWIIDMMYVSPLQNYMILPVLDNILRSIYQMVME